MDPAPEAAPTRLGPTHAFAAAKGLDATEVAERVQRGEVNRVRRETSRTIGGIVRANLVNVFNIAIFSMAAVLLALYAGGTMLTAVIGGYISDRMGKRKIFVIIASCIMAVSGIILAFVPEGQEGIGLTMIAALILGIGYGWYLAVDQALITQVLPTAGDRAKDLGVINIANSMPQVLAPVLAAPLVTVLGGYTSLYLATAVITVLGAIAIIPIKSVP